MQINTNTNQYKVVLSDHLYPMMKHFYPDGSGLFQDDNTPIHRAQGITEWFDEHENDVNHMLWPSQLPVFLSLGIDSTSLWNYSGGMNTIFQKDILLIKPFSDPSYPVNWGIVILEETTPIRIEMFHHRTKVITQNNFVLICSDPSL